MARKHRHESVLCAYTHALALYNQISVTNPTLDTQHGPILSGKLNEHRLLASDAAFSAVKAGNPEPAVEILEQGMRGLRSPLDILGEVDPELANQFSVVSFKVTVI